MNSRLFFPPRRSVSVGFLLIFLSLFGTILNAAFARADLANGNVLAVMESLIVPASDVLWNFDSSIPAEQWTSLEKAAEAIIAGADMLKDRAVGTTGIDWALENDWQMHLAEMRKAAKVARLAARERKQDAFEEAAFSVYPPCESCHQIYNPGVTAGQE